MTFGELKTLVKVLLIGDTQLPGSDDEILSLLDMIQYRVAMEAEALSLMTKDSINNEILRKCSVNSWLIRRPLIPKDDDTNIDLDTELTYAVANYMAGSLSKQRSAILNAEATRIINNFNTATYDILYDIEFDPLTAGDIF